MSVIVKGMKMPKYCDVCPVEMERKTRECDRISYCTITREVVRWWMNDRHESSYGKCPLIELPAQHGRLIDADALKSVICEALKNALNDDSVNIFGAELAKFVAQGFIDEIENAPTVVEAEEG